MAARGVSRHRVGAVAEVKVPTDTPHPPEPDPTVSRPASRNTAEPMAPGHNGNPRLHMLEGPFRGLPTTKNDQN